MNIYLIKRAEDAIDWDEIAGMVIIASTREAAINYFLKDASVYKVTENDISVEIIGETVPEYPYTKTHDILTDFRAG